MFFKSANLGMTKLIKNYKSIKLKKVVKDFILNARQNLYNIISKLKDLEKTNFDLGLHHYLNNNISDAILRFKIVKFFNPKNFASLYYIGRCYLEKFQYSKAQRYLEEYIKSSDQKYAQEAKYCLDVIGRKTEDIKSIPYSIIKSTFDKLANTYLTKNVVDYDLTIQQDLFTNIMQTLLDKEKPFVGNVLDLGCGVGILGQLCRSQKIANNIIGVEISEKISSIAESLVDENMKTYNKIEVKSYQSYLEDAIKNEQKYDVIFISDLITYNPDVEFLFEKISLISKEDTLIGLTFRTHNKKNNIGFKCTLEQFYFAYKYIVDLAKKYHLHIVKEVDTTFANKSAGKIIIFAKQ